MCYSKYLQVTWIVFIDMFLEVYSKAEIKSFGDSISIVIYMSTILNLIDVIESNQFMCVSYLIVRVFCFILYNVMNNARW